MSTKGAKGAVVQAGNLRPVMVHSFKMKVELKKIVA
jgi:hypothetical protein